MIVGGVCVYMRQTETEKEKVDIRSERIAFQNIYNGYFNWKCRSRKRKWKARHVKVEVIHRNRRVEVSLLDFIAQTQRKMKEAEISLFGSSPVDQV